MRVTRVNKVDAAKANRCSYDTPFTGDYRHASESVDYSGSCWCALRKLTTSLPDQSFAKASLFPRLELTPKYFTAARGNCDYYDRCEIVAIELDSFVV